ncbi:MAG: SpoIID/LytB domain-containing protein [Desulfobacterota bacterium]|nr:SpoIID/LytB domain-containing protein [Thermodesulfobacteriota bacterium]
MKLYVLLILVIAAGSCIGAPVPKYAPATAAGQHLITRAEMYLSKGRYLEALSFCNDVLLNKGIWPEQDIVAAETMVRTIHRSYVNDNDTGCAAYPSLPTDIRVLIEETRDPLVIRAPTQMIVATDAGTPVLLVPEQSDLIIRSDNGSLDVNTQRAPHRLTITSASGTDLFVNGRRYCGVLQVHADNQTILLINKVPLEQYLEGVLPFEIFPSWPEQALQAQAIASRTYALYHMIKRNADPFDVYATTSSQMYGGCTNTSSRIKTAVAATRGMVLTYDSRIILALFHANSGGMTADVQHLWGFQTPSLAAVPDPFSEHHIGDQWETTITACDIRNRLQAVGLQLHEDFTVVPVQRDMTGRVAVVKILQQQSFFLTGNSFRLLIGASQIKSTRFSVTKKKTSFVFSGRGYGHGAGMSQWGAYEMARRGYDAKQILRFYYPTATLSVVESGRCKNEEAASPP